MIMEVSADLANSWPAVLWNGALGSVVGTLIAGLITVLVAWRLYVHERDERREYEHRERLRAREQDLRDAVARLSASLMPVMRRLDAMAKGEKVPRDESVENALADLVSAVLMHAFGAEPKLADLITGLGDVMPRTNDVEPMRVWLRALDTAIGSYIAFPERLKAGAISVESVLRSAEAWEARTASGSPRE